MAKHIKAIPNSVSLFRIICVPFYLYFIANGDQFGALATLILGSVSDFFDGYLARRLGAESKLGELLDPIADKVFANSILWGMYLYTSPTLPTLLLAILLTARDASLLIGGLVVCVKKLNVNMKPIFLSKLCTTLVFCFIILSHLTSSVFLDTLGYISVGLAVMTFYLYINRSRVGTSSTRL